MKDFTKEEILNICNKTVELINEEINQSRILAYKNNKLVNNSDFEAGMLLSAQDLFPEENVYHPKDAKGGVDIFFTLRNAGYELKVANKWRNRVTATFSNGRRTKNDTPENFLFIVPILKNGKVELLHAYYGTLAYNQWNYKILNKLNEKTGEYEEYIYGMTINENTVKELCEQII